MARGSPIIRLRLPPDLLAQVAGTLARFERTRRGAVLDLSGFIRRAVRHELAHLDRARRPYGKRLRARREREARRRTIALHEPAGTPPHAPEVAA